ncbi:MAG: Lrp/AsnC ligand binding domain-containing protein [Sulfolobales archaeon]
MAKALVLINTEVGGENETLDILKSLDEIKELYLVYGVYDIVALIEAETIEKLKDIITNKIRRLPKIRSTLTMVIVESLERS